MIRRIKNQRGDLNVLTIALTLPILLLVIGAAADISRIPIIKQQLTSVLHGASDLILHRTARGASDVSEPAASLNWCMWLSTNQPSYACSCTDNICSDPFVSYDGASDMKAALFSAMKSLTSTTLPMLSHRSEDVALKVSVFNIEVDAHGNPKSYTQVAGQSSGTLNVTLSEMSVIETLRASENGMRGPQIRPDVLVTAPGQQTAPISVAILQAAVRTKPFIGYSKVFFDKSEESNGAAEAIVRATIVRTLPRPMKLSGPANNVPAPESLEIPVN